MSKPGEVMLGEEVSKVSGQVNLKEMKVAEVALKVNDKDHNSASVKKPAWLKKLEEMKMKNLDDMKTG
jgi:hypothetical protein